MTHTLLSKHRFAGLVAALAVAATGLAGAGPAQATTHTGGSGAARPAPVARHACDDPGPGQVRCLALVRTDAAARSAGAVAHARSTAAATVARPAGFGPADLAAAYHLPARTAKGQTVAVVDAYDNPRAASDLAKYRATYGLPPCTEASGCFTKLNQNGKRSSYPPFDSGWATESALDVDMVSAACPSCRIILVEARSDYLEDMAKAVDTAVAAGADVVTNSYGIDEFSGMGSLAKHYRHRGVAVLASSGDYGFTAAAFPAVVPGVTAVGGTSLRRARNARGWTERAWWGAGSGCSAYIRKPAYQTDRHCHMRTIADLSAIADPDTGVAVYNSNRNPYGLPRGWMVMGGTSVASPYVAGLVARAGHARSFTTGNLYAHRGSLYDVVGGSNGFCGGDYLCTAKKGYDGPTGLGSPRGLGAF